VTSQYKYRAFISYSHKDEKWAAWLHKALETFKIPKYLVGETTTMGTIPERMGKVFRDREELSSSHSLGTDLTQALEDSACQIVICSPNAANSHWTNEEILTYKRLGRENRIFCLIVDGEPGTDAECFPPAVRFQMGADGVLSDKPAEPTCRRKIQISAGFAMSCEWPVLNVTPRTTEILLVWSSLCGSGSATETLVSLAIFVAKGRSACSVFGAPNAWRSGPSGSVLLSSRSSS